MQSLSYLRLDFSKRLLHSQRCNNLLWLIATLTSNDDWTFRQMTILFETLRCGCTYRKALTSFSLSIPKLDKSFGYKQLSFKLYLELLLSWFFYSLNKRINYAQETCSEPRIGQGTMNWIPILSDVIDCQLKSAGYSNYDYRRWSLAVAFCLQCRSIWLMSILLFTILQFGDTNKID